jgi:hypothetical protein
MISESDSALGHHLDQIMRAEFEHQVPSDAEDDDFLVEVPTPEEILRRGRCCHPSRYRLHGRHRPGLWSSLGPWARGVGITDHVRKLVAMLQSPLIQWPPQKSPCE